MRVKIFQIFPLVNKEKRCHGLGCLEAGTGTEFWGMRCLLGGQHLYYELNCVLPKDMLKS